MCLSNQGAIRFKKFWAQFLTIYCTNILKIYCNNWILFELLISPTENMLSKKWCMPQTTLAGWLGKTSLREPLHVECRDCFSNLRLHSAPRSRAAWQTSLNINMFCQQTRQRNPKSSPSGGITDDSSWQGTLMETVDVGKNGCATTADSFTSKAFSLSDSFQLLSGRSSLIKLYNGENNAEVNDGPRKPSRSQYTAQTCCALSNSNRSE